MLKLNKKHRSWIVLAVVAWLLVLAALIFIPKTRAESGVQSGHAGTLQQSLLSSEPASGDAVVGQLVDPSRIYDAATYAGYISLCPNEPQGLAEDKIAQLGIDANEVDLGGKYGYVVLLPADGSDVVLDKVDLNAVDICTVPMDQPYPLNAPLPFYISDGAWTLGANAQ
ncbi:hypothetical protein [uncultured Corynebacterium sp.]|uniref:hypothetical protein n=1 Tax=uncultured Corynebacterium sp. TaxID=159447 RepID=UPI0025991BAB|nr:hypothetical protein [uncultured Corynebacterium sp.]